jgi:hypothetical protein
MVVRIEELATLSVRSREWLDISALDLEIFITLQAAMEMVEI